MSNRSWLLILPLVLLASGGCSVIVNNKLDSKTDGGSGSCDPSAPPECVHDWDCPDALMHCVANACGVDVCQCPTLFALSTPAADAGVADGGADAGPVDAGPGGGNSCVWVGFIQDPGFEIGIPPWVKTGDAVVDPTATGDVDPGMASFDTYALCNGDSVSQGIQVPPRASLAPVVADHGLVLEAHYRGTASTSDPYGYVQTPGPKVSIGNGDIMLPAADAGWSTHRQCLGASVYGQSMDVSVVASSPSPTCSGSATYNLDIDHLEVVPPMPNECPAIGSLFNGNMESNLGWTFSPCSSANGAAKTCAYSAGTGDGGSRSIDLMTTYGCSTVTASAAVSLPLASDVPNMAVEMWVNGTSGLTMNVSLGGVALMSVTGTGSGALVRRCVPPALYGRVEQLSFGWYTGGSCLVAADQEFFIDNVQLVSDVGCAP